MSCITDLVRDGTCSYFFPSFRTNIPKDDPLGNYTYDSFLVYAQPTQKFEIKNHASFQNPYGKNLCSKIRVMEALRTYILLNLK